MSVPFLTEALPGFRAWTIDREGRLLPAAVGEPWTTGVNVAGCAHGHGHDAPAGDCTCGLYAFHTVHRQLAGEAHVGAIAAWGDMEVHRDGFRAGRARVLALADAPGDRVQRAAERYGVPVLARDALLPLVALQTGVLPAEVIGTDVSRRRGYDPDQHVWVEPGGGVVAVGVSEALQARLGGELRVEAVPGGLRVTGCSRAAEVRVPVRGRPVDAARLVPSHWAQDWAGFAWGPAGRRRQEAAPLEHLLTGEGYDPDAPTSWADVRAALRDRRAPDAVFADAAALYDEVGIALGAALAGAAGHLGRLDLTLALAVREPDARLVLDLRPGGVGLRCGDGSGARPDVTIELVGDDLRPLLAGRLDLAQAAGGGRLAVTGPRSRALTALAILVGWTRRRLPEAVLA